MSHPRVRREAPHPGDPCSKGEGILPTSRRIIFPLRRKALRIRPVSCAFEKKIAWDFRALAEKGCGITGDFSSPPPGGLSLRAMNRAQSVAHWSGIPSLSHLWMAALLRLAAMLVSNAACFLRMRPSRLPGECHADVTPQALPSATSGHHSRETQPAAASSQTLEGLMPGAGEAGVLKHEAAFTGASQTSRHSADVLLPRTGEAQGARTAERSRPGGGPPHRLATAPAAPHRIVCALRPSHAPLPRSGEENRARVTS
jgi:hypothetical protein